MRFDASAILDCIARNRVTIFMGVPTMYTAMLGDPRLHEYDLTSLKLCSSGGASLPGVVIKLLSLDDGEIEVSPGEKGEIAIKGANIMKGYWHNDAATDEIMTSDGFMRTGDVAYMNEDGYLFIVDCIAPRACCYVAVTTCIRGCWRRPPTSIRRWPKCASLACPMNTGASHPRPLSSSMKGAEPFTLEEFQEFLKDKLGGHEMMRELEIREELPKTAVSKLSKEMLMDEEERKRAAAKA